LGINKHYFDLVVGEWPCKCSWWLSCSFILLLYMSICMYCCVPLSAGVNKVETNTDTVIGENSGGSP